jgi:hypothetical protein
VFTAGADAAAGGSDTPHDKLRAVIAIKPHSLFIRASDSSSGEWRARLQSSRHQESRPPV